METTDSVLRDTPDHEISPHSDNPQPEVCRTFTRIQTTSTEYNDQVYTSITK